MKHQWNTTHPNGEAICDKCGVRRERWTVQVLNAKGWNYHYKGKPLGQTEPNCPPTP